MARVSFYFWILGLFLLTLTAASLPNSVAAPTPSAGKILLVVSVDWEGDHLESDNLAAMNEFREQFPQIPLLHFLNAAYFTKPGLDPNAVARTMQSVLRPGDENGLHLHGWKRLFNAAGVAFRETPNFWGNSSPQGNCDYDCGHEISISGYTTEELRKVIRYSINTLGRYGFGPTHSFRAGGWMGSPNVLEALVAEGITLDSSALPAELLYDRLAGTPLYNMVKQLWPQMTTSTQPWKIQTDQGPILELPDNGGLADYVTADEMVSIYQAAAQKLLQNPGQNVILQYGFHEETAELYLPRLEQGLRAVFAQARAQGVQIQAAELPLKRN